MNGKTYECMGGPYDGAAVALPDGSCELAVWFCEHPMSWRAPDPDAPIWPRMWQGRYVVRPQPLDAAPVLAWEGCP